jgi:dihydrolipoamide dehydrogenase
LSPARDEGMTKLLFDEASERVIGVGVGGPYVGELIAEIVHAIEMGADAADIALTSIRAPHSRRPSAWRPGRSGAP